MLTIQKGQRGFSLVELIVGVLIIGILMATAAPALSNWVQNSQIRTTAQAILNGLQLARGNAVHRNANVRFQLTSTLDDTCVLSTTNSNWVVSLDDPTGECGDAPSDTDVPRIIQKRSSGEGSGNAVVATTGQSTFTFSGLGSLTTTAGTISVTNPTGGACAPAGPMNCMNIVVTIGGQVRMCNPAKAATDPQGC
jgi:type IV fimbrial biogenesis protein FimT